MQDLLASAKRFDFAVLVLVPHDVLRLRELEVPTVRDNLLFELGLFVGQLGPERVFFLLPRDVEIHLPTDLLGIMPLTYRSSREDGNLRAALGAACNVVRKALRKHDRLPFARSQARMMDAAHENSEEQLLLILRIHQASIAGEVSKRLLKAILNASVNPLPQRLEELKREMVLVLRSKREELFKFGTTRRTLKEYVEASYTPADIESDYVAIRSVLTDGRVNDPLQQTDSIEKIIEESQLAAREKIRAMIRQDLS